MREEERGTESKREEKRGWVWKIEKNLRKERKGQIMRVADKEKRKG